MAVAGWEMEMTLFVILLLGFVGVGDTKCQVTAKLQLSSAENVIG